LPIVEVLTPSQVADHVARPQAALLDSVDESVVTRPAVVRPPTWPSVRFRHIDTKPEQSVRHLLADSSAWLPLWLQGTELSGHWVAAGCWISIRVMDIAPPPPAR